MEKRAIMQPEKAFLPSGGFDAANLMEPREAISFYLSRVAIETPASETVAINDAYGRILDEDVDVDRDYPDAPRSAMDGFALQAGAGQRYTIAGEVTMGRAPDFVVAPGRAARIPTGGVVPDGCDAVVPLEDVRVDGGSIALSEPAKSGDNITPRGSDILRGERLLQRGRRLRAADAALLATLGRARVRVVQKPRIAVMSTGDELIAPDREPQPGQIRDSNRYGIAATLQAWGCVAEHVPTVSDEPGALEAALRAAIGDGYRAVVLTGGSSVGARDETPGALNALGRPGVVVHGLRVKPGKPTVLGAVGSTPVIGLPGNPASALTILQAVAAPVFAALAGAPASQSVSHAVLDGELRSRPGWTWYVPVELEHEGTRLVAHPLPLRSSAVSLIARAAGYVVMGESETQWNAGHPVAVYHFV